MEGGYKDNSGLYPYPARAILSGVTYALKIMLVTFREDVDDLCRLASPQGYRVVLHAPLRLPRPSQEYFLVPLDNVVLGAIHPVMISTSESVKQYNPEKRMCYFTEERKLRYFKLYSQLNCKIECLVNRTLEHCGCVEFFMPRENGTLICGPANTDCLKEVELDVHFGDVMTKLKRLHIKKKKAQQSQNSKCDCLPLCTDITYDVQTSQTIWNWRSTYKAVVYNMSVNFDPNLVHLSTLTLFFKSSQFITSQRNELYGPTDFIANFGGLLGLFTGFSILSLMEIIYFLSVRLFCNRRLYGYWTGKEN